MNDPIPANGASDSIAALQRQVFALLLALIVVSGTLTVYLYRQATVLGKDLNASRQLVQTINQSQPQLLSFANQLAAYGQTHPDFRPILQKYGIPLQAGQTPAPTPAPKR